MAVLALVTNISTIPMQMSIGVSPELLVDRALDMIFIAVPPAIPAAMSCGIVFAVKRLKAQDIFCISPPRVNMAGQISTFVFDKTGTLTEEGLSVLGFRPTQLVKLQTHGLKGSEEGSTASMFCNFTQEINELTPKNVAWWMDDD